MLYLAKLKLILIIVAALGSGACLTAGLAWAVGTKEFGQPADDKVLAAVAKAPRPRPAGNPHSNGRRSTGSSWTKPTGRSQGAEVIADAFMVTEARGTTTANGSFTITIPRKQVDGVSLLARSPAVARLAAFSTLTT